MTNPNDEWKQNILGAIARGWCSEENEHKVMDSDLAKAIYQEIVPIIHETLAAHDAELVRRIEGVRDKCNCVENGHKTHDSKYGCPVQSGIDYNHALDDVLSIIRKVV